MKTSRLAPIASFTTLALSLFCCAAPSGDHADESESDLRSRGGGDDTGGGSGSGGGHTVTTRCYQDADGDGYTGSAWRNVTGYRCPAGWSTDLPSDCDDTNADVKPRGCAQDQDHDGHLGTAPITTCTSAAACASAGDDCNDYDATVFPKTCLTDADGDLFAGQTTMCVGSCPGTPSGVNVNIIDCNDSSAAIRPLRREVPGNAIDDNCANGADEAQFVFTAGGDQQGSRSVRLDFVLNDADAIAAAQGGTLYASVYYARLVASRAWGRLPFQPVALSNTSLGFQGSITVDGLLPSTVYDMFVVLSRDPQGNDLLPLPTWDRNGHQVSSEEFVTMTLAESPDRLEQIRPVMVNTALALWGGAEHGDFQYGLGICGHCDARAGKTGEWCSEFYNNVANHWFVPMFVIIGSDQVDTTSVRDAFVTYGIWYGYELDPGRLLSTTYVEAGDYVMTGTNGSMDHSQMFLAYDSDTQKYWNVAGNVMNTVGFGPSDPTSATNTSGIGRLTAGMLK